jgi:hypothetical protein
LHQQQQQQQQQQQMSVDLQELLDFAQASSQGLLYSGPTDNVSLPLNAQSEQPNFDWHELDRLADDGDDDDNDGDEAHIASWAQMLVPTTIKDPLPKPPNVSIRRFLIKSNPA